ncbi:MAG: IS982 family transposase, partial [Pseudomonadota bacterium]
KSFEGFKTRILTKITALTLVQFINKFEFGRPINNLKVNLN